MIPHSKGYSSTEVLVSRYEGLRPGRTSRKGGFMRRKPQQEGGWIRASLWKYVLKWDSNTVDDSHRGERHSALAFKTLNADQTQDPRWGLDSSKGLEEAPTEFDPLSKMVKENLMSRVDPDCADSVFAEYEPSCWTGTEWKRLPSFHPELESELLAGVDAIIDFVQATQITSTSESKRPSLKAATSNQ